MEEAGSQAARAARAAPPTSLAAENYLENVKNVD